MSPLISWSRPVFFVRSASRSGVAPGSGRMLVLARIGPAPAIAEIEVGGGLAEVEAHRRAELGRVELGGVLAVARVDHAETISDEVGPARTAVERIVAQRERPCRLAGRPGNRDVALGQAYRRRPGRSLRTPFEAAGHPAGLGDHIGNPSGQARDVEVGTVDDLDTDHVVRRNAGQLIVDVGRLAGQPFAVNEHVARGLAKAALLVPASETATAAFDTEAGHVLEHLESVARGVAGEVGGGVDLALADGGVGSGRGAELRVPGGRRLRRLMCLRRPAPGLRRWLKPVPRSWRRPARRQGVRPAQ